MKLRRRDFLATTGPAVASACARDRRAQPVEPAFEGQDPGRGHKLRDGQMRGRSPDATHAVDVVIVGGGAAGLSAAWRLKRAGVDNFVVLELEPALGGTARAGRSDVSAYPMGAHYLPAPHPECSELEAFLEAIGLITGRDAAGKAQYLPSAICAAPTERHYFKGLWHEGLYPHLGQTQEEADDFERWQDHLRELDARRDAQGQRLFRLPLHRSSPELRHLDRISMAEHLETLGIRSWRTRWLIDYACRDDYGCTAAQTSAFAGLHHFLSRGLEERRDAYLLTGPEGNGRLVKGLAELAELGPRLHLDTLVTQLDPESGELRSWHATEDRVHAWKAQQIIWAAPRFVLSRVLERDPHAAAVAESSYAPWLVANLSLRRAPRGAGAPLAWDNVAIEGDDLGYVVATHGEGGRPPDAPAQVTFYQAFAAPGAELRKRRAELLAGDAAHWGRYVMDRMRRMHDDIDELVTQLRIHRWGHAMIRPTPEALFGSAAQRRRASIGRVHPCGTDTQGLALFEEAFYAGHEAAETVIAALAGSEATAERG